MSDDQNENDNFVTLVKTLKDVQTAEIIDGLMDVSKTRKKLGEFTNRDMHEALFGKEYTDLLLGEDGGNVKMKDIHLETSATADGRLIARVDPSQLQNRITDQTKLDSVLNEHGEKTTKAHLENPEFERVAFESTSRGSTTRAVAADFSDDLLEGLTPEEIAVLKKALGKLK